MTDGPTSMPFNPYTHIPGPSSLLNKAHPKVLKDYRALALKSYVGNTFGRPKLSHLHLWSVQHRTPCSLPTRRTVKSATLSFTCFTYFHPDKAGSTVRIVVVLTQCSLYTASSGHSPCVLGNWLPVLQTTVGKTEEVSNRNCNEQHTSSRSSQKREHCLCHLKTDQILFSSHFS